MKVVARRTGLSPYLIRMWERRYKAVQPFRTETNRRLYSDDDIERLILLRRARDDGESIGQMAKLSNDQLRDIVPGAESSFGGDSRCLEKLQSPDFMRHALRSIRDLDQAGLESCLLRARAEMEPQRYLERIIAPLLEEMGEEWSDGRARAAHEHLVSSVIRSVLGTIIASDHAEDNSPVLIFTTPAGQQHELGALMAAVTAAAAGWRAVYLGPNLPAEEIAAAARESRARAVALSIIYPPDDPRIEMELTRLRQSIGAQVPLMIGGRAAESYRTAIDGVGAEIVRNLKDFKVRLDSIRA